MSTGISPFVGVWVRLLDRLVGDRLGLEEAALGGHPGQQDERDAEAEDDQVRCRRAPPVAGDDLVADVEQEDARDRRQQHAGEEEEGEATGSLTADGLAAVSHGGAATPGGGYEESYEKGQTL